MSAGNGAVERIYADQVMTFRDEMAQVAAKLAEIVELVRSHGAQHGGEVARLAGHVQVLDADIKELKQAVLDPPMRQRASKKGTHHG